MSPESKVRVLIATTTGPVEVLLLAEEDPAIGRSVACIGGTTQIADIDSGYDAFVARRTGVVERLYGHPCYRIDFSDRIDAGSSWQLGVLIAHALHAAGRLAAEAEPASMILWATGTVRSVDLSLGAVSHVGEKISASQQRLGAELDAGRTVMMVLPEGNLGDVPIDPLKALGIEVLAAQTVRQVFSSLFLSLPRAKAVSSTVSAGILDRPPTLKVLVSLAALLAIAFLGYVSFTWLSGGNPAEGAPLVARLEQLMPKERAVRAATDYELESENRALVIGSRTRRFWSVGELPSGEIASLLGQERCYLAFREACVTIAINNGVAQLAADWPKRAKVPERILYRGEFKVDEIAAVSPQTRERSDVTEYAKAVGPKATAIHANGRFYVITSSDTQANAEAKALEMCNNDNDRSFRPCYLYSSGDVVTLWAMSNAPLAK